MSQIEISIYKENSERRMNLNKILSELQIPKKISYSTKPKPLRRTFWISFEKYKPLNVESPR